MALQADGSIKALHKDQSLRTKEAAKYKTWETYDSIATGYVFDRLNKNTIKLVENMQTTKEQWKLLRKQYSDTRFTMRRITLVNLFTTSGVLQ